MRALTKSQGSTEKSPTPAALPSVKVEPGGVDIDLTSLSDDEVILTGARNLKFNEKYANVGTAEHAISLSDSEEEERTEDLDEWATMFEKKCPRSVPLSTTRSNLNFSGKQ